jgi:hypothetical protein
MSWNASHARVRKLWNIGDSSLRDIGDALGMPVDEVEAYLRGQPGFPGIVGALRVTCRAPRCGQEFDAWHRARRYCSDACRNASTTRRWRQAKRAKRESVAAQEPSEMERVS